MRQHVFQPMQRTARSRKWEWIQHLKYSIIKLFVEIQLSLILTRYFEINQGILSAFPTNYQRAKNWKRRPENIDEDIEN